MNALPGMWREELWHPKVVHFSVALLTFGALLYVIHLLFWTKDTGAKLHFAARLSLLSGVAAAWCSIYTGDVADGVVGRTLCDPIAAETHAYYGYILSYLFTGALAADFALGRFGALSWRRIGNAAVAVALVAGAGIVGYVGHLGGQLVFQQGAAVHHPSGDCAEFLP